MLSVVQDEAIRELCRQGHQEEAARAIYCYERKLPYMLIPPHDYTRIELLNVLRANDELVGNDFED